MAISTLRLNVAANTSRALADFNKFSRSLDNKFLVSGLKLDVVRSALSQINRDFTRAIGEQGLASASSLRAAQNQAALLTSTFKGFSVESALAISTNIGTALNKVAVQAGGTMKDVQRTLAATPFISTRIGDDLRDRLTKGMMEFNKNARRAGLGDNSSGIAQQFLMGRATGMQLIESGDPMAAFLGSEIVKRAGGEGYVFDPAERSRIMADIYGDKKISEQLELMAKRTYGFRIILEDLNTYLFNPEAGVFGALRKVMDSAGNPTTMFDEVEKLTESVFGKEGMFAKLVKAIRSVFGDYDPMRPFIDGIQLMQRVFEDIGKYFESSGFKKVVEFAKEVIDGVTGVFKGLYDQIKSGSFDSTGIVEIVGDLGNTVREYIKNIGRSIRNRDDDEAIGFVADIGGTLLEEVGKTTITLIRELFATLADKAPEIASKVLPAINNGINSILQETFGAFAPMVKTIMATMPGPLGMAARASMITDATGGQGGLGLLGAAAPFLLAGSGGPIGALKSLGGTGRGATAFRGLGLGLAGLDPAVSLLGAFAPQLLGNIPGAAKELREAPGRVMNTRPGRILTRGLKGGFGLLGRGGNLLARGAGYLGTVGAGYLGAVGPLAQRAGGFAVNQLARVENLYNTAYVGARGVGRQFLSGLRPGAFPTFRTTPTVPYQAGQFVRNIPGNLLASADSLAKGSVNFVKTVGNSSKNMVRTVFSAASAVKGGITSLGTQALSGSRAAVASVSRAITNIIASIISLGTQVLNSSKAALVNIGKAITNIVASIVSLGNQVLASSKAALASMGTALRNMVSGIVALGSRVLASSVTFLGKIATATVNLVTSLVSMGNSASAAATGAAARINMSARGFGVTALAGGGLAIATQAIGQKVGGEKGEAIGDIGGIMASAISTIGTAAGLYALKGTPLGPKGMAIAGLIGAALAAIGLLTTKNIDTGDGINNFSGKNYLGPALALEARMSGRRPMVVNDGEFVIPKDGFPILAGLVGQNLRSTGVIASANNNTPTQVNVSLSLTTHSVVANADELVETMRQPVYQIISDAIKEVENSRISRTATA